MTTQTGYAAELLGSRNYDGMLPAIAPASVYSRLAEWGLRVSFAGIGTIKIPTKLGSPLVSGDFIGEGNRFRRGGSAWRRPVLDRRASSRCCAISPTSFRPVRRQRSRRCCARPLPTTPRPLDSLLNGATGLTPTAGGGTAALAGDLWGPVQARVVCLA
jgi:hypothetical protein